VIALCKLFSSSTRVQPREVGLLIEENAKAEGGYEYLGYAGHDILEPGQFGVGL
jgi:hypothetical protein